MPLMLDITRIEGERGGNGPDGSIDACKRGRKARALK